MNVSIKSNRLRIRHFEATDIEDFVGFMIDPDSTKFLTFDQAQKSREGAEELLRFTIDSYASESPLMAFAIEDRTSGKLVGFCGLTPREDGDVEIMYATLESFRGNGYAVETASTLAQYAIEELGFSRVIAPISMEHGVSKAVAVKAGFQNSGIYKSPDSSREVNIYVYVQPQN
ncbi:MAG: GNAT family N-acetyltransferase [Pseudomonadales bacterium]|nr:GNAT family N-acetyltransferase [Pseudomonadales bacterium]